MTVDSDGKDAQTPAKRSIHPVVVGAVLVALGLTSVVAVWLSRNSDVAITDSPSRSNAVLPANIPGSLLSGFTTDFTNSSLDSFSSVVNGGPGKDGIPALNNPEFEPISESEIADTTRGVLVELNDETRFYPYNLLVWHEIANDTLGDTPIAVTFCPLCGSAIVFDRRVNGEELEFGVSGFLRESNMIMFDRNTESLWQQSTGDSFAGVFNESKLDTIQFQLLEMFRVKDQFPNATVMTLDTGHSRDYTVYPYGNYDNNEQLFFDVSVDDNRYPIKEIFYAVTVNDTPVALRVGKLESDGAPVTFQQGDISLEATKKDGLIDVRETGAIEALPGYYEMWFSWATWHQDNGIVWEP